jgi:peptidoglycan/LPS O-acetylase OafA/YrhL
LFTYTSNIFFATHHWGDAGHIGHFWSLAVEEQFYLVWPWLLVFLPRQRLLPLVIAVISLGPLYRFYAFHQYGPGDVARGVFTLAVIDSLGIGALLAILTRTIPAARLRHWLLYVGLLVGLGGYFILVAIGDRGPGDELSFGLTTTAAALVFGWLVVGAAKGYLGVLGRLLALQPFVYVGKISYGVYVFHNLVIAAVIKAGPRVGFDYHPGIRGLIVVTAVTIAVASLSWHFFERPLNGLKRHFAYRARRVERQPIAAEVSTASLN